MSKGQPVLKTGFVIKKKKAKVLNPLLRNFSITGKKGGLYSSLSSDIYEMVARNSEFEEERVREIIKLFLKEIELNRIVNKRSEFNWSHDLDKLWLKSRILLHRYHRIAPVFDYERARENLKRLQKLFSRLMFWPQISTQIALTIFITDKYRKNVNQNKPILQKNIRKICDCSAYAFHRTRNRLNKNLNYDI